MDSIKVSKTALREALIKNRDGHREKYLRAFDGYVVECERVLKENLRLVKAGRFQRLLWTETPPQDHTAEYDRIISMLDMSLDTEIELTAMEFQQYVQDDWTWKGIFAASTAKYLETK